MVAEFQKLTVELAAFAEKLALLAGKMMIEELKLGLQVDAKSSSHDLVTNSDIAIENKLKEIILKRYKNHMVLGEETCHFIKCDKLTDDITWIIDPIDGTRNYVHGYQSFCISIAVTYFKNLMVGVVYNPMKKDMYTAIAGRGARKNGKPISCSNITKLQSALVIVERGCLRSEKIISKTIENNNRVMAKAGAVRMNGSAALNLCYVAEGSADGYFEFGIYIWDYAAGVLIAKEAGACVINPQDGGAVELFNRCVLCTSTEKLASEINGLIEVIHLDRN